MSLARSMAYKILGMLVCFVLLGGASLWGLSGLSDQVRLARDEYRELRMIQEIGIHAAAAHALLQAHEVDQRLIIEAIRSAIQELDSFMAFRETAAGEDVHQQREVAAAHVARSDLGAVLLELEDGPAPATDAEWERAAHRVDHALTSLNRLASQMDQVIAQTQTAASRKLQHTLTAMAGLALLAVALIIGLNLWQYRSVVWPLRQLREGVRRLAAGNFKGQVDMAGASEFSDLATDFNRMARELDGLYATLEQKVVCKSRELVRSERLASVGFLAAGVAHEINNPLNIITGYAELSLRQLRKSGEDPAFTEVLKGLQIIREEGFRCKEITGKLLSLTRSGKEARKPVSIAAVVQEVASMVATLRQYRERRLRVEISGACPLEVWANETELKQVLLNLAVNALEAVKPGSGQVTLAAGREGESVELVVEDNGRGMGPETLEHVFEPFFTERRGGERCNGLGLSITHAIVAAHGGRIEAHSAGPGQGSRFTVHFPLYQASAGRDGKVA